MEAGHVNVNGLESLSTGVRCWITKMKPMVDFSMDRVSVSLDWSRMSEHPPNGQYKASKNCQSLFFDVCYILCLYCVD